MAVDLPGLTAPGRPRPARRAVLNRRIRWFVAATIAYNVVEAAVAITAGTIASSAALIGFGLDSLVEVTSAAAVAWQFAAKDPETREKTALRIIAFSFFTLAAYVTVDAVRSLFGAGEARPSTVGLILAAVSLAVMPFLSYGQRKAGRELGSRAAVADSKQTLLCTYLSAVLLVGLGLNTVFGWSWADPIAALVIAAVAVKEGREAWQGDTCCAPNLSASTDAAINDTSASVTAAADICTDGCCPPEHCRNGGTTMTDTHQHAQDTGDGHAHAHDAGAKGHADTAGDHGHGGGSVPGGGGHLRQPLSMPQESPGIMSSAGLIHDP